MDAVKLGLVVVLVFGAPLGAALAQAGPSPAAASAPAAAPLEDRIVMRRGETAELSGRSAEMAFVSGDWVRVTAEVADDIFAAGRDLRVEGARADHLFAAGGELDLAPAVVRDLVAAGGRIQLRAGAVSDDLVAAGGEISLERGARIEGSTVLVGGKLRIDTPIGRELIASGGRIELNGPVGRDVRLRGDEIVIGPNARIGGDLHVRGAKVEVSPGAVVQGRTVREVVERKQRSGAAGFVLLAALFALGVLLMKGVVAAAAPRLVDAVDRRLRTRLAAVTAIGAVIVLLGPVVVVALLASGLGAPLGLLVVLAWLLALPLAFAGVAYWLGQWIRGRAVPARAAEPPRWPARFGWTLLGGLLLVILSAIPFIGGLIWLLIAAAGVGALAVSAFEANWPWPRPSETPTAV